MHLWIQRQQESHPMHEVQCRPVSRAEDHACSNTPRRTTVGPPDSNPTMIRRLTFNHLRLPPTSIHIHTTKTLLQIRLHHLQLHLPSHSSLHRRNHHHLSLKLHFNKINSIQQSLNLFLQNLFACFLTFLLDTQLHFPVLQKLQILIIFPLLILSSMLLATSLMTTCLTCLRTFWNLHIQDSLGQFGLPHLAVFIQHLGRMMEDPLHWHPKNSLMVSLHFPPIKNAKSRNPKRYIVDRISFALLCSNKEASQARNNHLTPLLGRNPLANSLWSNVPATLWPLQLANGDSIFSNIGQLLLLQTIFQTWQAIVHIEITWTLEEKDFLTDPTSVHSQQNTLQHSPPQSLTSFRHGSLNLHWWIKTCQHGEVCYLETQSQKDLGSLTAPVTSAQQIGLYHSQLIFSNLFDRCGSNASLRPNYILR